MSELHPKLSLGIVWCTTCGESQKVNSRYALSNGWPKCCGYTMTIDSPAERKQFEAITNAEREG